MPHFFEHLAIANAHNLTKRCGAGESGPPLIRSRKKWGHLHMNKSLFFAIQYGMLITNVQILIKIWGGLRG